MKFPKKHRIFTAAAPEGSSRYAIDSVLLERDDDGARLVATNGRILAVVPVEDADGDVPGPISQATIRAACKDKSKSRSEAEILVPDEKVARVVGKDSLSEHPRPDDGARFPDWRAVVPKHKETPISVILSGRELRNLIEALGVLDDELDGIRLTFGLVDGKIDDSAPVRVDPAAAGNEAYGVIMPISEM